MMPKLEMYRIYIYITPINP